MCYTIIFSLIILKKGKYSAPKIHVFEKFLSPYNGHSCGTVRPRGPNRSAVER